MAAWQRHIAAGLCDLLFSLLTNLSCLFSVTVDVLEMLQKDDYRSQREAVRVMVILNLTSGGSQERMAELCRLGAAKPRCDLLGVN